MATKQKRPEPPTGVRFEAEMRGWLTAYARQMDLTVSQVVRRAVAEYRRHSVLNVTPDVVRKAGG